MSIPRSLHTITFLPEPTRDVGYECLTKIRANGRYGHGVFWSAVIEPRIKLCESKLKELRKLGLVKAKYTSMKNDVKDYGAFRIENLTALFCVILTDYQFKGKDTRHCYAGYTFNDFKIIFDYLNKDDLRKAEELFQGQNEGKSLLKHYNDLLRKLSGRRHPFGKVQLTKNWELISSRRNSGRVLLLFEIIAIIVLAFGAKSFYSKAFPTEEEKRAAVELLRKNTNNRLEELINLRQWSQFNTEANELIENEEIKDVVLYNMGLAEMIKRVKDKNPSYYLFQIDSESELFEPSFILLLSYYTYIHNEAEIATQMDAAFDHLKSKGYHKNPFWYYMKIRTCIAKNRPREDKRKINVNTAYRELNSIYSDMKGSLSDLFDYNQLKPKYDGGLPLPLEEVEEYNKTFPFDRQNQIQAVTFFVIQNLRELSTPETVTREWWDLRIKKFKEQNSIASVDRGLSLFGHEIDPDRQFAKDWNEVHIKEDRSWFTYMDSTRVNQMKEIQKKLKAGKR